MTTDISPTLSNKLPPNYIPMTPQMVFNAAWKAFIVVNKPPAVAIQYESFLDSCTYKCVYSDKNGNKCAIGLCLPEGHRAASMFASVETLQVAYPELFADPTDQVTYKVLQRGLHDSLINNKTGEWKYTLQERSEQYRRVAESLNLTVPSDSNII